MEPRPTLETVARRAAVSRQTVSNALNSPQIVRPETLQRVLDVIEEVGYRPHAAARQMRTRRSQVLGLRLQANADGINGSVLDRFLHALTEQAQVRGYRIMLFTASDDDGEISQYSEMLDTLEIDGFVLTATHHGDVRTRWLADHDVPFVTFGRPWSTPGDPDGAPVHAWVDVNGAAGTRAAVEHLLGAGHTRIAYVGWRDGSEVGDDRRAGWRRAMAATGLPDQTLDALEVGIADGVANGARAASRLSELVAPTAFVCASDSLALGVLTATRPVVGRRSDQGDVSLPAVIGFDDTPVARGVGLSSVAQPLTEAAGRSLTLLLDQVAARHDGSLPGEHPSDAHVLLNPNLVIRDSSETTH
jgi:DNA-binding LacI/PurR family transcriptional regulator